MTEMQWTVEMEQVVIELAHKKSRSEIAAILGTTRSAVSGKITRLTKRGLIKVAGRKERKGGRPKGKRGTKPKPAAPRVTRPAPVRAPAPGRSSGKMIEAFVGREPPIVRKGRRLGLLELQPHHCRFPYGDVGRQGFGFCGARRLEGKSYCPEHYRFAHQGVR